MGKNTPPQRNLVRSNEVDLTIMKGVVGILNHSTNHGKDRQKEHFDDQN